MTRIPPRPVARPPRSRFLWIAGGIVLAAALALIVVRHPRFKSWRATQLADKALAALEAGDADSAGNEAVAAFQLAPRNPQALRAASRVAAARHDPQALVFFRALAELGAADGEDYLAAATAALDSGFSDIFQENIRGAIDRLPPGDLRVERLLGRYALLNGDFDAAIRAFRGIADKQPDSAAAKLDLAAALLASPQMSARRTAPPIVEDAVRRDPALTARAMLMLGEAAGLPQETRLDALHRLLDAKDATFADRLSAWRLMIRIDPSSRDATIASVLKLDDAEHRADIARWLVQVGANDRALQMLPLRTAATQMDLFLIWLDAAAGLGRWGDVENALKRPDAPLPPSTRDLFYGRALAEQGKPSSDLYYEKAIAEADGDVSRLFYLAGYFKKIGRLQLAERALDLLTRDPAAARTAYEALIGIRRRNHDTAALTNVLERMHKRWPDDPAINNDVRYLHILTHRDVATAFEDARAEAEKHPGALPFRMTWALALLDAGRNAEALALFEQSNLQLAQLLPQQQAIFAAIMAANGDRSAARDVARLVNRDLLLPEELDLLEKAEGR